MTLEAYTFKQLLIYCMLIGISHEAALIGENVRDARPLDKLSFIVSIAQKSHGESTFQNRHFCTGTLISRRIVLTARHCLVNKRVSEVVIIAGSTDVSLGKKYYPKSWVTFDEWSKNVGNNESIEDIAAIRLKGKGIYTNPNITKASLMLDPTDLYNSTIRIAGWGISETRERPLILKTALLNVISNEECSAKNAQLGKPFDVSPDYFCSTAIPYVLSSCGDSGAPIMNMQNQVVGMHVGVCPDLEGYPPEFENSNLYNIHLYLYFYKEFIDHVRGH